MGATIIIPARYGSVRLAGKPLLRMHGRTLIEHTWRAARRTGLPVWIATDDERIEAEAKRFGAFTIRTGECENGTERCAEAAERLKLDGPVVNWQGDSPLVPPDWIPALLERLGDAPVATLVQRCTDEQAGRIAPGLSGATTVALQDDFRALYFSKSPIPFRGPFWLHVGIYAYTPRALRFYGRSPGRLEQSEALEQLRFLERGIPIVCVPLDGRPIWEVNRFEDLRIVEQQLEEVQ